jgi:glycosyltransferase involved in cell wall biosynthesis
MKIGVMHWAFPPVVGGVESHLIYLYTELAQKGHEISILTAPHPERDDGSIGWCRITSDELMSIDALTRDIPEEGRYHKVYRMMEGFILKEKPEVIHAHNFHYFIPDHAECLDRLSKKYDIPIVLTIHNYWHDSLCRHLLRDIAWDRIVAVSYHMKSPCMFDAKLPPEKVEVHYHGVDLDKYSMMSDQEALKERFGLKGRQVVFHPARACKSKGSMHSIEAVSKLRVKYPNICLIVSGNGDSVDFERERPIFRSEVKTLIDELDMENNVLFVNATGEEMPLYMNASDVVIYPTIMPQGEAFGIGPVEGMACGKPVIVTRSGGLVESTSDKINGLILECDPGRLTDLLAESIDTLLSDKDLSGYYGKNGREIAMERFDSKKMALRMESLYYRLINERLAMGPGMRGSMINQKDREDNIKADTSISRSI